MTAINQSRPPSGTAEQAQQAASRVGQQAAQAGGQVGHAAAEQGRQVAAQARQEARHLTGEATSQVRDQARSQQHRAAEGLRGLGRDLGSMADRGADSGLAGQAVRQAATVADRAAGWLDEREPGEVLDDMRGYARQHPGMFLAGAAVAGVLAGRLTRNLTSGNGKRPSEQMGQTAQPGQPGPAGQQAVEAPYSGEGPYAGTARAEHASPAGRRETDIPGGVAP
ncbi:hypothetical protein ONA91_35470 [Micromonospora sp. DR5-3]|uniref:hypothetical protein n=1 Tax=unclassified Micromonospora TaxID=2617518 RepID=UPI0011DAA65B|nr:MULTISPECIES: hypothetical protein [unclassified Micromonospora]MCW3819749.1 hypothetical protein [Micromonospora sp. DR5-3]TYC23326.1 hypothetical protein FXF52_15940 [Micromonospora sp. MP36]